MHADVGGASVDACMRARVAACVIDTIIYIVPYGKYVDHIQNTNQNRNILIFKLTIHAARRHELSQV